MTRQFIEDGRSQSHFFEKTKNSFLDMVYGNVCTDLYPFWFGLGMKHVLRYTSKHRIPNIIAVTWIGSIQNGKKCTLALMYFCRFVLITSTWRLWYWVFYACLYILACVSSPDQTKTDGDLKFGWTQSHRPYLKRIHCKKVTLRAASLDKLPCHKFKYFLQ